MKVALDVLRRWIDLPADPHEVRRLLDECGLEVKRVEPAGASVSFTLELLANRGDHHCLEGIARELDGRLGAGFRSPEVTPLEVERFEVTGGTYPVRIESQLCLVYTATLLERGAEAGPLGPEALAVLAGAGLHAITAPIDATNVANLELGQPTHAFDADRIEGTLVVRTSRAGERAWPLFQPEPVPVPEGTLVIADDVKILAIAGVIGCEESKTTDTTRRLLLESATFDPVAVRLASRAMRISTDSSARFERGGDPERPVVGAGRVVRLLEQAGWRRVGLTSVFGTWKNPGRVLTIDAEAASSFLAVALSPADVSERLGRYGFRTRPDGERQTRLHVGVPSWRLWDVAFAADLYEELAKSLGYDNTPVALPPIDMGALPSPAEVRKTRVEEVLAGNGFYEVFTDGFYGRNAITQLGIPPEHPLYRHVETTNALDRAYSLLKNNCLHQAIEAVATNERRRTADVKMYEWTRTFHPIDGVTVHPPDPARPPCTERRVLWMVTAGRDRIKAWHDTGRPADVHFLKGVLAELAVELGLDLVLHPTPSVRASLVSGAGDHLLAPFLHPGRRGTVSSSGETVGILGEIHPAVARRYKLKAARPVYLELDTDALLATEGARPPYSDPPQTQPLVRSLAFALPHGLDAGDVAAVLHASGPDWLERVAIVDVFALPQSTDRSVTFELHYTNPEAARTAEEVNAATESLVRAVLEQFGPRGVHQR